MSPPVVSSTPDRVPDETELRTFAMRLVSGGYVVGLAALALVLLLKVLPAANAPIGPVLFAIAALLIATFGFVGAVSVFWSDAPQRAWFWLAAAVPGLFLLTLKAREIPFDLTHPANAIPYLVTIVAVPAALAIVVGGLVAFLDVRRGRATWTRTGRAGLVLAAVAGGVMGAGLTSVVAAGSASVGGSGIAEAPTTSKVITAEHSKFVETRLDLNSGEVLGLFVINKDGIAHAFDVDSLGIHVQLPAASTTAIAIKPSGPGSLEFYCSVPGHRDAGMFGTINVD
jgi:Cupredoxin-like domain